MPLGRFICLEGIEGVGKSTQLPFIADYLQKSLSTRVITTREPGGTPFAESIRTLFLESKHQKEIILPETELLLMFAARRQHIMEVIQPALQQGHWVICDRFTETSYAYQGGGRELDLAWIDTLKTLVHQTLTIDRVILFDMNVSDALNRVKAKNAREGMTLDRMEQENSHFFECARQLYLKRAKEATPPYRILDASQPILKVQTQIIKILDELIAETDQ